MKPVFNDTNEVQLVANRDISEGDELTMAYVDVSTPDSESPSEAFERRRKEVKAGWGFDCTCTKCSEETKTFESTKVEATSAGENIVPAVEENVEKEPHSMEGSDVITVERETETGAGEA